MTAEGAVSPFQTVGPFFQVLLGAARGRDVLVGDDTAGERVTIQGTVFDGAAAAVPDALIEIWQADSHGRYRHPEDPGQGPRDDAFNGFGRASTADDGSFVFETVKPGRVAGPDGRFQAPHILFSVTARGVLTRYVTRLYFPDEVNSHDPILELIPPSRRETLIAKANGIHRYRFDIRLQGLAETVFLDV